MKIALFNTYTADYEELAKLTIANHKEYCDRHGYFYHVIKENCPYMPDFMFLRFPHLIKLFQDYDYDYIHFSGIDTLIMNYTIKIEDWIDKDYHFQLAKETSGGYRALNSDVFIVKNSPEGLGILKFIHSKMEIYKHRHWQEQAVMIDYFGHPELRDYIKIMPQQSFNSYPWKYYDQNQSGHADIHKGEPGDFKLGDFLLHAPGHTMANRLRIWAEFLPQVIK